MNEKNLENHQNIFCPFLMLIRLKFQPLGNSAYLHLTLFIWSRLRDLICCGGAVTVHNVLYIGQ
jgi:hypothetical protein